MSQTSMATDASFMLRIKNDSVPIDGESLPLWSFEIKGNMPVPRDHYQVRYRTVLADISDPQSQAPLRCIIPDLQGPTKEYLSQSEVHSVPYTNAVVTDWMRIAAVPVPALIFPRRGKRTIAATVHVFGVATGAALHTASVTLAYFVEEDGYLDALDQRRRVRSLVVHMVTALAAADGQVVDHETAALKGWIDCCAKQHGPDEAELLKAEEKIARRALRSKKGICLRPICDELRTIGTLAERYDALDVCLRVTAADGSATASERRVLQAYAQWLDVDFERFRTQMNKVLPSHMFAQGAISPEDVFGILPDMTQEQIRAKLNMEFRKYNGLVAHAKLEVRADAEMKVRMLAALRKKYCP